MSDKTTRQDLLNIPAMVLSGEYWRDRGLFLAGMYERHGPVFRTRHAGNDVLFLIGPEANRLVLASQRQAFSHARGWGWVFGDTLATPNLLTMDGPPHDWHRRLMNPAFAARRMESYLPLIARVIEKRLAAWAARGEVDVYEEARVITFDLAAAAFLGLRRDDEFALCRAVYLHGAKRRGGELAALLTRKIAERRAGGFDDALGLLAAATDAQLGALSDPQLLAHADILLVAGHETSASLAAWALYLLAEDHEYRRRVLEELATVWSGRQLSLEALGRMQLLDQALMEAERLYPPVPTAPRGVQSEVAFHGYLIPPGTQAYYSAAATHRLPQIWYTPAAFDPDRFAQPREEHKRTPYALVGFGGGPRVCIGRSFARIELLALLAWALRHCELAITPGQTIAVRYGVTSRPVHGIRMQVRTRGFDTPHG